MLNIFSICSTFITILVTYTNGVPASMTDDKDTYMGKRTPLRSQSWFGGTDRETPRPVITAEFLSPAAP